jgi:hypothetical protein
MATRRKTTPSNKNPNRLPAGWVADGRRPTSDGIEERLRYRGNTVKLVYGGTGHLDPAESLDDILAAMADNDDSITVVVESASRELFGMEDPGIDTIYYDNRDEALRDAKIVADRLADAKGVRMPDWKSEDIAQYLRWFQKQHPNQADYVRLFREADPNGEYDGLLLSDLKVSQQALEQVFEDELATRSRDAVDALASINRQRARLGQSPLRPDDGPTPWSDDDLIAEANRLREQNPRAARGRSTQYNPDESLAARLVQGRAR